MQLQDILSSLLTTPTHIQAVEFSALLAMVVFFLLALYFNAQDSTKVSMVFVSILSVMLMIALGTLIYESNSRNAAIDHAKITRSGDKIHVKSNSEFMKSVDLEVVAEKDGYIYVEFENKTYRIEDLSKKGN